MGARVAHKAEELVAFEMIRLGESFQPARPDGRSAGLLSSRRSRVESVAHFPVNHRSDRVG